MAYTKAPVSDTHNIVRIPTLGTSIEVSELSGTEAIVRTLSYIDCYPRKEKQWGKDPMHRVQKRNGWERNAISGPDVTGLAGQSIVVCEGTDKAYFCVGTDIIKMNSLGTPLTLTYTVQQASVTNAYQAAGTLGIDSTNANRVCFLTPSSRLYTFLEDGTSQTTTDLSGSVAVSGNYGLVFLNSYLFAVDSTGKIYNSTVGGNFTTWATTDYIVPEIYPDYAKWIDIHKNHLVAFSKNSIEFFYDGGVEIGSPLVRQETYASRIGLADTSYNKKTCRINDDIYFMGRNSNNVVSLYRIKDFRVEEIDNRYIQDVLNWVSSIGDSTQISGIETIIIGNTPMICININNGRNHDLVYYPDEDCWWMLRTTDYAGDPVVNSDFPHWYYRCGWTVYPYFSASNANQPMLFSKDVTGAASKLWYYSPAWDTVPTVQADIYTEVIDFGINYYKQIPRIDAIGDYGNNTLTLSYNGTPNYSQTYTACTPTRSPSTAGYGYNASWYNLGAFRRFSLKLTLSGTDQFYHDGFDVEYNVGAA